MSYKTSYQISLVLLLTWVFSTSGTKAQSIFLDPDVQYITTGVGTEFNLELRVDAAVTSLKSIVYHINFDPTKLDTVSVIQGPLLPSAAGGSTMFGVYIVDDRLEIQDLILGAGIDVAGPGLVATIRFVVIDTGTIDLSVVHHRLRDVNGTLLATTASGSIIHINVPPAPFDLISPIGGASVSGLPGDNFDLTWDPTTSVYPGETVLYTLEYSSVPTFDSPNTTVMSGLTSPNVTIDIGDLEIGFEDIYYWRVTATGDINGYERSSSPAYESFNFEYVHVPPEPFDLVAPVDLAEIGGATDVMFDWQDATTVVPGDYIEYDWYLGPTADLPADAIRSETSSSSEVLASIVGLPRNVPLYWIVIATNKYDLSTMVPSAYSLTLLGCCTGRTGDANDSGGDEPTIGDISALIDLTFILGTPLACWAEGDVNQSGGVEPDKDDITIGDISYLIDYLFITGPSLGLPDCL